MVIELTLIYHVKYELHDVFTVVKPHQDPNYFETVNLYTDFPSLATAEFAQSNVWYKPITEDPHCKYFLHDIKQMNECLVHNPKEKLVTKVNEIYLSYQL